MGRRSRKRDAGIAAPSARNAAPAAAPATPRRKTRREEAPEPPWGRFPLVELVILAGILLVVAGFLTAGARQGVLISGGVALICLASLELTIREHLAGYRSHTTLLAAVAAVAVMAPLYFAGTSRLVVLAGGVVAGGVAFGVLRRAFQRRSGGLGFRA